jgi:hypothetical protein
MRDEQDLRRGSASGVQVIDIAVATCPRLGWAGREAAEAGGEAGGWRVAWGGLEVCNFMVGVYDVFAEADKTLCM